MYLKGKLNVWKLGEILGTIENGGDGPSAGALDVDSPKSKNQDGKHFWSRNNCFS